MNTKARDVMDKLPPFCFGVNPSTQRLIKVKRGVMGYFPQPLQSGDQQEIADKMNKELGVTPQQAEAMLVGSCFGFDVPGADPDSYEVRVVPKENC